jgi:hypothetical protein
MSNIADQQIKKMCGGRNKDRLNQTERADAGAHTKAQNRTVIEHHTHVLVPSHTQAAMIAGKSSLSAAV